jgi:hypothetical protein
LVVGGGAGAPAGDFAGSGGAQNSQAVSQKLSSIGVHTFDEGNIRLRTG